MTGRERHLAVSNGSTTNGAGNHKKERDDRAAPVPTSSRRSSVPGGSGVPRSSSPRTDIPSRRPSRRTTHAAPLDARPASETTNAPTSPPTAMPSTASPIVHSQALRFSSIHRRGPHNHRNINTGVLRKPVYLGGPRRVLYLSVRSVYSTESNPACEHRAPSPGRFSFSNSCNVLQPRDPPAPDKVDRTP